MSAISLNAILADLSRPVLAGEYETVLKYLNDYSIYTLFIGYPPPIKTPISSPLRVDRKVSFSIYYPRESRWDGQLLFKDFNGETGNIFKFVMLWAFHNEGRRLITPGEIASYIFEKQGDGNVVPVLTPPPDPGELYSANIIRGTMRKHHLEFWEDLGVRPEMLAHYNVSACDYLLNSQNIMMKDFRNTTTFAYVIFDRFKLYQPYEENFMKFFSQCPPDYIQGYPQCIGTETLCITKAMKDILVYQSHLREWTDIIAPHGEGFILSDAWVEWILRYPTIIIIFDPDRTGVQGANRLRKQLLGSPHYKGNTIRVDFISTRRVYRQGEWMVPVKDIGDYRLIYGEARTVKKVNQIFYDWREERKPESTKCEESGYPRKQDQGTVG